MIHILTDISEENGIMTVKQKKTINMFLFDVKTNSWCWICKWLVSKFYDEKEDIDF